MDTTTTTAPAETKPKDDRVMQDLRNLVEDAERLLKTTARAGDERLESMRDRVHDEWKRLRAQLEEMEEAAALRVRQAARSTDQAVHAHPYAAMGAAAAAGLLLGYLLGRR